MSRLEQLAEVFERASKERGNITDPPFGQVTVTFKPETWAEIAVALRAFVQTKS